MTVYLKTWTNLKMADFELILFTELSENFNFLISKLWLCSSLFWPFCNNSYCLSQNVTLYLRTLTSFQKKNVFSLQNIDFFFFLTQSIYFILQNFDIIAVIYSLNLFIFAGFQPNIWPFHPSVSTFYFKTWFCITGFLLFNHGNLTCFAVFWIFIWRYYFEPKKIDFLS